jgi:hypothetical protein
MAALDSEDDEGIILGSAGNRRKYQRLVSSSSDDETEEEAEVETHKQEKKRKRIRSPQVTEIDEDDSSATSHHNPSCSSSFEEQTPKKGRKFVKETRFNSDSDDIVELEDIKRIRKQRKIKLEMMAKGKNPKYQSPLKKNINEIESEDDHEDASLNKFDEKTRVFKAKFNKPCDLPSCSQSHIKNVTKILGVRIFDDNLGTYIGKTLQDGKESHFWVCATHSRFWQDFSDQEEEDENVYESSSSEDDTLDDSKPFRKFGQ